MSPRLRSRALIGPALLLGLGWAASAQAQLYSGRAFGASVKLVNPNPNLVMFSDTGQLPPTGGSLSASLATVQLGVTTLSSATVTASTAGIHFVASSSASQQNLVCFGGQPAQVRASVVTAQTQVSCNGVQGSSVITGLTFGGVPVVVTGQANQRVSIGVVATLMINEQIVESGLSITVNALHLFLGTGEEVIVSSAHSDFGCPVGTQAAPWGQIKALYR